MAGLKEVRFRTQFDTDYNPDIFATDPGDDEGLVQQHMAEECDVNAIMRKYQSTGSLTHVVDMVGAYGDFSDVTDYKSGLERIMAADDLFMELPAHVRDRFGNDPVQFLEFATNSENIDEMRKLGLAPMPPAPPEPQLVKVVPEADPDDKSGAKK